jgi:hypothetical protein
MGLSACVEDPLPNWRPALVCWPSRGAACVDGCLLALCVTVVPRTGLMVYVGRRALGLLHGLLLDEGLCLAAQVACLRCRGFGHNPK